MGRDWFFPFKEAHFSAYLLQGAISLRMSWDLQVEVCTTDWRAMMPIAVLTAPVAPT